MAQQPTVGQGLLSVEASRLHSETPHLVGLLWTSGQPDAETTTQQHPTLTREIHASAGFEVAIVASEGLQTHALDRATTGIG